MCAWTRVKYEYECLHKYECEKWRKNVEQECEVIMWYVWFLENKRMELRTSIQGEVNVLYLASDRSRTENVTI